MQVRIPALRERVEDIRAIAERFCAMPPPSKGFAALRR